MEEIVIVVAVRHVVIRFVAAVEGDQGDALLLRQSLHGGIPRPALVIVSMTVKKVENREFRRRLMCGTDTGLMIAGGEGRDSDLNVYAVGQRVGVKVNFKPCHNRNPPFI